MSHNNKDESVSDSEEPVPAILVKVVKEKSKPSDTDDKDDIEYDDLAITAAEIEEFEKE